MGKREMGGYWCAQEGWEVSTMWKEQGLQKKISEMRSYSEGPKNVIWTESKRSQKKKSCW